MRVSGSLLTFHTLPTVVQHLFGNLLVDSLVNNNLLANITTHGYAKPYEPTANQLTASRLAFVPLIAGWSQGSKVARSM